MPSPERASHEPRLASTPTGPDAEVLSLLADGRMELVRPIRHASNFTFLVRLASEREDRELLGVYKPRDGEAPLWDFPDGTLHRREVSAFVLSQALGWPSVPPTVLRDGIHGPGSVQLFVRAQVQEHFFTLRDRHADEFRQVAAFDVVANNADRKGGHCLLDFEGRIHAIDHGVCFAAEPKLRTVIWDFAGEPLPAGLLAGVCRVAEELRAPSALRTRMRDLLTDVEVEATAWRAERLAEAGRYPYPRGGRPFPWPPV